MLNDDDDCPRRWRVALYADQDRRPVLEGFAARHRSDLAGWDLRAPGPLATALHQMGLRVRALPAGLSETARAIAADLAAGELDALILLRDPFAAAGPTPDGGLLIRLADLHNVASATNLATAECLVQGLAPRPRASRIAVPQPSPAWPLFPPARPGSSMAADRSPASRSAPISGSAD